MSQSDEPRVTEHYRLELWRRVPGTDAIWEPVGREEFDHPDAPEQFKQRFPKFVRLLTLTLSDVAQRLRTDRYHVPPIEQQYLRYIDPDGFSATVRSQWGPYETDT